MFVPGENVLELNSIASFQAQDMLAYHSGHSITTMFGYTLKPPPIFTHLFIRRLFLFLIHSCAENMEICW